MDYLLLQTKPQCESTENEPDISKCVWLSLICAVRGKHLLMKGRCSPLDPSGKQNKNNAHFIL